MLHISLLPFLNDYFILIHDSAIRLEFAHVKPKKILNIGHFFRNEAGNMLMGYDVSSIIDIALGAHMTARRAGSRHATLAARSHFYFASPDYSASAAGFIRLSMI